MHLLGEKIAVVEIQEEITGSIILPEHRLIRHELGRVVSVGDGHYRTGEKKDMWVKEGDIVLYQLGAPQQNNAKFKLDGKPIKVFHQGDIIARLKTAVVNMDNFEIVGNWVLLSAEMEESIILVPQTAAAPETFIFKVVQKGAGFAYDGIEIGDTVFPERGRCAPIEIGGKTYVFTLQDFIHGVVKPNGGSVSVKTPAIESAAPGDCPVQTC